jgi:hypothetical protein
MDQSIKPMLFPVPVSIEMVLGSLEIRKKAVIAPSLIGY